MAMNKRTLDQTGLYDHPLYQLMLKTPGLSVGLASVDELLSWGVSNSLWVFPMATSCCGIELMAAAASRVDLDRMGTIVRATPRQADVMVVAGTITTKMAPRVKKLWDQMPEPKWCIAMGSCALSGDFYRNMYSVVPGIDTFLPVDVYVPGCPPNPEALMAGLLRLQEKVRRERAGEKVAPEPKPELLANTRPSVARLVDATRTPELDAAQLTASGHHTELEMGPPLMVGDVSEPIAPLHASDFISLLQELGVTDLPKDGPPLVPANQHVELARRLKALGYRQYVSVIATHWAAGTGRKGKDAAEVEHFEVTTVLRTVGRESKCATWAVRLLPGQVIATLTPLFAGAEWQEREQYDLVGVLFAGHPDLRRLMMAENFHGHPLRRDFPADAPAAPWR